MTQLSFSGFCNRDLSDSFFRQPTHEQSEALRNLSQEIEAVKRTLPEIKTEVDGLREPFNNLTCKFIRTRLDSEIIRVANAHLDVLIAFFRSPLSEEDKILVAIAQTAIEDMKELKNRVPDLIEKTREDPIVDNQETKHRPYLKDKSFKQS